VNRIIAISAITHVPIANAPPRSCSTTNEIGIATSPQKSVAISIERNGFTLWRYERYSVP